MNRCASLLPSALVAALLLVGSGACSRPAETAKEPAAAPAAAIAPAPEPQFEPAYPAEVSTEGLEAKDTEQQKQPHRHGDGEEHTHGEDEGDHGHD